MVADIVVSLAVSTRGGSFFADVAQPADGMRAHRLGPRATVRGRGTTLADMSVSPTVPVVAAGLIGGFAAARFSGRRELGGAVLAAAGGWCTREWARQSPAVAGGLLATYLTAFGASHPLAKKIGAWPSVFAVTGVTAGATYLATSRNS